MKKIAKLEEKINAFHKLATFDSQKQFEFYFNSIKNRLYNLSQGGIASINTSLAYNKSNNLNVLLQDFNQCAKICKSLNPNYSTSLDDLQNVLGGMTFFTSSNNTGTGYDSTTAKSFDDGKSPKYFVDMMNTLVSQLKKQVSDVVRS